MLKFFADHGGRLSEPTPSSHADGHDAAFASKTHAISSTSRRVGRSGETEETILQAALDSAAGAARCVRTAVALGADVNARGGPDGCTALHSAVRWGGGNGAAIRELVALGADVSLPCEPTASFSSGGESPLLDLILGPCPFPAALFALLVDAGADVDAVDTYGRSLAWHAKDRAGEEGERGRGSASEALRALLAEGAVIVGGPVTVDWASLGL